MFRTRITHLFDENISVTEFNRGVKVRNGVFVSRGHQIIRGLQSLLFMLRRGTELRCASQR